MGNPATEGRSLFQRGFLIDAKLRSIGCENSLRTIEALGKAISRGLDGVCYDDPYAY
jgi:hypothetical protein